MDNHFLMTYHGIYELGMESRSLAIHPSGQYHKQKFSFSRIKYFDFRDRKKNLKEISTYQHVKI